MNWRSNCLKTFDQKVSLMRHVIYHMPKAFAKTCAQNRTPQTARPDIHYCKYQVKPHLSSWFSAACAAAIARRNHFFCLY